MLSANPNFVVRCATCPADVAAAQALRFAVFVQEMGAGGADIDYCAGLEADRFDTHATHLLLEDMDRPAADRLVGVYRLMTAQQADDAGGFYCGPEFDLSCLLASKRKLLELGRSCVHPDYRGGTALLHLWKGLADFVGKQGAEVLFGVASFHGTDVAALSEPLAYLAHKHAAGPALTATAKAPNAIAMDSMPMDQIDRKAAMRATPALIKAYLRLGGVVGQGAYVDHDFNTIDVCLILDTAQMNTRASALYGAGT